MAVPKEFLYSDDHEWIYVSEGEATIGITDHAQSELGDVVFVELPEVGKEYDQFEDFAVIESVKAVSDIYLPVGGKIIEINEELIDQPELINEDPYDKGWLVKVEIADEAELDNLMDSEEYEEYLEEGE